MFAGAKFRLTEQPIEKTIKLLEEKCYNIHVGRDESARLFEEVFKAAANDRHNYGPFVRSPLERVNPAGLR